MATTWDTLHWIGPANVNDTTLVSPENLVAWGERIAVMERSVSQVRVFGRDGDLLWAYGREGRGPGELAWIAAISPTPRGNLWILDCRNPKVVELNPRGEMVGEHSLRHLPVPPGALSFTPAGNVLFLANSPTNAYMLATADSLRLLSVAPSPWADSVDARFNTRMVAASDSATGTMVQALALGPAFALMRPGATRAEPFPYLNFIPWTLKASPRLSAARADSARYGAVAADVAEGEIYFLFGGRPDRYAHPPEPTVLVDVYGLDGAYRRSYLLPLDAEDLVVLDPDRFAVLGMHEGLFPRIYILRPTPAGRGS